MTSTVPWSLVSSIVSSFLFIARGTNYKVRSRETLDIVTQARPAVILLLKSSNFSKANNPRGKHALHDKQWHVVSEQINIGFGLMEVCGSDAVCDSGNQEPRGPKGVLLLLPARWNLSPWPPLTPPDMLGNTEYLSHAHLLFPTHLSRKSKHTSVSHTETYKHKHTHPGRKLTKYDVCWNFQGRQQKTGPYFCSLVMKLWMF